MIRTAFAMALAFLAALSLAAGAPPLAAAPAAPSSPAGGVQTQEVEYRHGDTLLRGFLALPPGQGQAPGLLVVHEWWGLNDNIRERARELAGEGYVALAVDMYGEGRSTTDAAQAQEWSTAVRENGEAARGRFTAAYDLLRDHERTLDDRLGALGFCFGGFVVLRMGQLGTDLDAVVSFHGVLPTEPIPAGTEVKAAFLVAHGSADPFVTPEQMRQFQELLAGAGATWQLNVYGGAKHAFTNPGADALGMEGIAYDPWAHRRSWVDMLNFLRDRFAQPQTARR